MKRKSKLDPKIFKEGKFTIKNFILAIFDIFEIYNNNKIGKVF
jgi:hypothetical protein